MNEDKTFYINNSSATRFFMIFIIIIFGPFSLITLLGSLDSFELGDWLNGLLLILTGGLLGLIVFACILGMVHTKTYIKLGNGCITINKPKKRYSFAFYKYNIYYGEVKWIFFNKIKTLPTMKCPRRYRYLFLVKKVGADCAFIARNDWNGKRSWKGLLSKKTSVVEKLNEKLVGKGVKQYDKFVDNLEFDKILQENEHAIRIGNNYKMQYISNENTGTIIYNYNNGIVDLVHKYLGN